MYYAFEYLPPSWRRVEKVFMWWVAYQTKMLFITFIHYEYRWYQPNFIFLRSSSLHSPWNEIVLIRAAFALISPFVLLLIIYFMTLISTPTTVLSVFHPLQTNVFTSSNSFESPIFVCHHDPCKPFWHFEVLLVIHEREIFDDWKLRMNWWFECDIPFSEAQASATVISIRWYLKPFPFS